MKWHEGEQSVQVKAGVAQKAARLTGMVQTTIPEAAAAFLRQQTAIYLTSIDEQGDPWVSIQTGVPGFVKVTQVDQMEVRRTELPGDPLYTNLRQNNEIGLLIIEPATRRRMRINGWAEVGEFLRVHTRQVYGNCPKYITARMLEPAGGGQVLTSRLGNRLTAANQDLIRGADTFIIGTYHETGGADASHRGGNPGFVQLINDRTLVFPDYSGNNMFNTLGNIEVNRRAGLLFIDYAGGQALQLTGRAEILWKAGVAGAERQIQFEITRLNELTGHFLDQVGRSQLSPVNPEVA